MIMFVRAISLNEPLQGVTITVYDSEGAIDQVSISGEDGKALIDVQEDLNYYVRASKEGTVTQIYALPLQDNAVYDIEIVPSSLSPAADPERCRVQGYIVNVLGEPVKWPFKISAFEGVARSKEGVIYSDATVYPDNSGEYDFELVRDVSYVVYDIPNYSVRVCHAPDTPSIAIQDFIFPTITSLGNLPDTLTLRPDSETAFVLTINLSNGLEGDLSLIKASTSNSHVEAHIASGYLKIKGISVGKSVVSISQVIDVEEGLYGSLRGDLLHSIAVEVI